MQPRQPSQRDSRRVCSCCLALSGSRVRECEPTPDLLLPNGTSPGIWLGDGSIHSRRQIHGGKIACALDDKISPSDNCADIARIISPKDKFLGKNRGCFSDAVVI